MNGGTTEGLSREALFDLHNHLLEINSNIRVNQRWGDFTEYSMRLRAKDASQLLGQPADKDATWRVVVGIEERRAAEPRATFIDIERHDGRAWVSACFTHDGSQALVDYRAVVARVDSFIATAYPDMRTLLEIDCKLLDERV